MIKLFYIGTDDWDRPVYKDETGKIWKDINLGNGTPHLHSSSNNGFDGEPDMPIKGEFEIIGEAGNIPESDMKFQYMMLDRMRCDCEYYLGHGNRRKSILMEGNEKDHIAEMKRIWNSFPDDGKPEWLPWEKIVDYEKRMVCVL